MAIAATTKNTSHISVISNSVLKIGVKKLVHKDITNQ